MNINVNKNIKLRAYLKTIVNNFKVKKYIRGQSFVRPNTKTNI